VAYLEPEKEIILSKSTIMKIVQELMTDYSQSCCQNESIEIASERMRLSRLNSLVVLDEQKVVVGTLSYLDVCVAPLRIKKISSDIKVMEVMSNNIYTINTHDDETLALNLMRQFHMNSLPVVDKENKIQGIIRFFTLARRIVSFKSHFNRHVSKPFHSELA
jgi:CBS domain-containing protein